MGLFTFIDRFRASSSDRSPWGDFFFEPVSVRSASGMRVSPDGALRLAAVYACVRILSETMASLPVVVYRQRKDGGKDRVTDHWLYGLLARKPNRFQNPFEWREMLQGHLALRGNAFCQIISNPKGEITELMPIHPDRVRIEVMDSGDFRYRVRMQNGDETVFPRGQIWHLRGLSSDGLMGMSPIELARESLGMALAAQDYGARFFSNDAKPTGGWIEFPGTFKDPEAKRVFRESYQAAQSGSNRGKVLVLENGMKFHEVGVTNKDAQFLELRKFQITDIARLFRVPPHMIADLDRATFSNIEQQSLEFVMHTMTPWAERWEASIESDLMLAGDQLEVEDAEEAEQENEPNASEPNDNDAPSGDQEMSMRFRKLVQSNASRLGRRIARKGLLDTNEIHLISQAFGLNESHVRTWAQQQTQPFEDNALAASLIQLGMNT